MLLPDLDVCIQKKSFLLLWQVFLEFQLKFIIQRQTKKTFIGLEYVMVFAGTLINCGGGTIWYCMFAQEVFQI